jgi:hypothetical protein
LLSSYPPCQAPIIPLGSPIFLSSPTAPVRETGVSAPVAHPIIAEGNYCYPSDQLFSVYHSQAGKFDREQVDSWKGEMEILVFA